MTNKWLTAVVLAAIVGAGIFAAGLWIGRALLWGGSTAGFAWSMMQGGGMMGGYGMMDGYSPSGGPGMMDSLPGERQNPSSDITIEGARQAVEAYLREWGYDDLRVGEVMLFTNQAYAEVEDPASGRGAFEVLVDPVSKAVFLEYGPAMMWNTEYGMMGGRSTGMYGGMMGGMMGGRIRGYPNPSTGPSVTPQDAVKIAQDYLDAYLPGYKADETADEFPGYYTLHTLQGGTVVGMLSVNAYTGQVWYHTWHGTFLEMSETEGK